MKKYFLASLTVLCLLGIFTLAVYLDSSKLVEKRDMLQMECDSLDQQIEARQQLIINQEKNIQLNHRKLIKLRNL